MTKKQSINISIPKPCHENWDTMSVNEQGRHCGSCHKTVVDFSLYTDKELFEFLKKANGNICGRMNAYQVNRPILIAEQNRTLFHKLFFGTALASWLGLTGTANAQSNKTHVLTEQGNPRKMIGHISTVQGNAPNKSCTVKGIVNDSSLGSKQPVPFAEMQLFDHGKKIDSNYTDINGYFSFKIKNEYLSKNLTLLFDYIGYEPETVNFVANSSVVTINLNVNELREIMGDIVVIDTLKALPLNNPPDKTTVKPSDTPYFPPHK